MNSILPPEGLFSRTAAWEGLVLRAVNALHLRGAFFPTGENPGLAPFPNHVELCLLTHMSVDSPITIFYPSFCFLHSF
jgi:hypothetical protein